MSETRSTPTAGPAGDAARGRLERLARAPAEHRTPAAVDNGSAGRSTDRAVDRLAAAPTGPVYHALGELDPPPRPLGDIEPDYPAEAGFQPGKVMLRLFISETGDVDRVDVIQASPPGVFDAAARVAFGAARFSPGRIAGVPVKCQLTVEVEFTPINRGNAVSGRTY